MAMSDPIADMLTRIRNAGKAKFESVDIPGSRMKTEIAKVLKSEGYIRNYKFISDQKQGVLRVYLKVSKPSRRIYVKGSKIDPVLNGLGIAILSTSKGIMTDKTARQQNIGGELLCHVW